MSTEDHNFAQARKFWGGIDYDIKTTPPQPPQRPWVGLTREEFEQCYESMGEPMDDWALGRAIEATLRSKNT